MPQQINDQKVYSLFEVMKSVQKVVNNRYRSSYWIKAEMIKLNFCGRSGHCYPDLLEKREGKAVAQIRASLWDNDYKKINNRFLKVLNEPLKEGIKILFLAKITFDLTRGLGLNILDIDPQFTLGDLEREKQDVIRRLREENLFNQNKSLKMTLLPKRIAIISVETSKGYADFLNVINHNQGKYKFTHHLFPSLLQGEHAVPKIVSQLECISNLAHQFDMVAIIRGGGGDMGLSCYNDYRLAKAICSFPLPVVTGIGHSTNETVCEMVAYENAITPTKLAENLVQKFSQFDRTLEESQQKIHTHTIRLLDTLKTKLERTINSFSSLTTNILTAHENNINNMHGVLLRQSLFRFKEEKIKLTAIEENINNLNPKNVIKRGYSITTCQGKPLIDIQTLKEGDEIQTILETGKIISIVKSIK